MTPEELDAIKARLMGPDESRWVGGSLPVGRAGATRRARPGPPTGGWRDEVTTTDYDGWRRRDITRMTPAELAIREAILAVEAVGADIRLTEAVILLVDARERLADFVDGIKPEPTKSRDALGMP